MSHTKQKKLVNIIDIITGKIRYQKNYNDIDFGSIKSNGNLLALEYYPSYGCRVFDLIDMQSGKTLKKEVDQVFIESNCTVKLYPSTGKIEKTFYNPITTISGLILCRLIKEKKDHISKIGLENYLQKYPHLKNMFDNLETQLQKYLKNKLKK